MLSKKFCFLHYTVKKLLGSFVLSEHPEQESNEK